MKNKLVILFTFLLLVGNAQESFNKTKDEEYIRTFAKVAVEEMHFHKIPASVKLGQGLLETADGQSELAKNANNHFGIKCKETWTGETYRYTDDAYMECFRKYPTAIDSYKDHSQFLLTRKHYASLFLLEPTDYKGWAYGLKKAGYATNPKYPQILISKIEKYNLQNFDKLKVEEVDTYLDSIYPNSNEVKLDIKVEEPQTKIVENKIEVETPTKTIELSPEITKTIEFSFNQRVRKHKNGEIQYVLLQKDEQLVYISNLTGVSVQDLLRYNDLSDESQLKSGQYIFIEPKKTKGIEKTYKVKAGDTLYSIAQSEGIQLQELCNKNNLTTNQILKTGEKLFLRGNK